MLQLDAIHFAFKNHSDVKVHDEQGQSTKAETLANISLNLDQGTLAAVMGESGCGKSTLLNVIYGLLQAQSGNLFWNGEELLGADHHLIPGHSMMKYVPQEFDLMPFTTVTENVGEHLSIQMDDRGDRIKELLEVVEMERFADRKVKTLSGGQKQRVAIAKALAQRPELLLLDEPFSHVDNFRKNNLRRRLFHYLKSQNISCLIATHDREDVLSFTDETIVMQHGKIVDHRKTEILYGNPNSRYVASLFNDINEIPAAWFGTQVDLLLYPYQLKISKSGLKAVVNNSYFKGGHFLIGCEYKEQQLWVASNSDRELGSTVFIDLI
jgi:ABC-type sulfate/molybdate transport systems ATPase subunit